MGVRVEIVVPGDVLLPGATGVGANGVGGGLATEKLIVLVANNVPLAIVTSDFTV